MQGESEVQGLLVRLRRALAELNNEEIKPRFIGVAYSFQQVEDCFPEKHDIKMDEMLVVKL